ncbi:rhodanese-like domain-containing protein [Endozoicomonas sp. SM1973]|uniref:Rhodanese-like domain-containing protein n=1 Tax=Spartinivicinus marinus TaxID=2994442 RepID=A0A853I5Q7_9GAMM|nr:rhodanese-like domain-containing protein [Spartinivicinus marinus]MCX4025857.1 rhodanese-like domain-containing protein [Spartinivicinus marinus]NYZ68673.1 rhodanese-like domain-containing protein [Spartinivicinus marinus]
MNATLFKQNYTVVILLISLVALNISTASNFPLREKYKDIPIIELNTLGEELSDTIVIDVRSKAEYNVIHIANAHNIPLSNMGFTSKVQNLRKENPNKKIIVYCNGHTCAKSYKATKKLMDSNIDNCYAFDAGIFDWVNKYPENSSLLGESPADLNKIISKDEFKQHTLEKDHFESKLNSTKNSVVIDIRESVQRSFSPSYSNIRNIPFDRFTKALKNSKYKDKTMFIFDAVGKQVKWLQYHLKNHQYQSYYFLKGGVKALQK